MVDYNALFAKIRRFKVWGTLTLDLQDGEVKHIAYQRSFRSPEDLLDDLNQFTPPDEEQPTGDFDVHPRVHQNGQASQTR